MRPRAILFDFYNTLGVDRAPGDSVEAAVLAEFGFSVDPAAVLAARAAVQARLDGDEPIDHAAYSVSRAHYTEYQRLLHAPWLRALGVDPYHPGLFERIADAWDDPSRIVLFPDTLPALGRLRAAGYRIGVVSNWSWGLQDVLDNLLLSPLLECAVISARAGYRKPHPEIYAQALRALDLPAEAVLFVGDNPHADIDGPLTAGMTPIHIDRFDAHRRREGVRRITHLGELADTLGV